jgi:acyl-CoA thioester hydrolase
MIQPLPFRWPIRVYYEHTDAGGVVYHAVYAQFLEQARTEFLRQMGVSLGVFAEEVGVVFAVRALALEFIAPARLDDLLEVTVAAREVRPASITFEQSIFRESRLLCSGVVRVASICAKRFRPVPLPTSLDPFLQRLLDQPRQ